MSPALCCILSFTSGVAEVHDQQAAAERAAAAGAGVGGGPGAARLSRVGRGLRLHRVASLRAVQTARGRRQVRSRCVCVCVCVYVRGHACVRAVCLRACDLHLARWSWVFPVPFM